MTSRGDLRRAEELHEWVTTVWWRIADRSAGRERERRRIERERAIERVQEPWRQQK